MISMTSDQTEQLEVAKKIMACSDNEHYHNPLGECVDCNKQEKEACAILSRHSALMKKRGAVEALKRFEKWCETNYPKGRLYPDYHESDVAKELEREIKELEAR